VIGGRWLWLFLRALGSLSYSKIVKRINRTIDYMILYLTKSLPPAFTCIFRQQMREVVWKSGIGVVKYVSSDAWVVLTDQEKILILSYNYGQCCQ
jgi:hypothetical protein